jgi:cytochrome c oxidase subunit 4
MTDQGTEVAEPGTEVVAATEGNGALVSRAEHAPVVHAVDHGNHPTPRQYVLIAIVLVIITALEVAASYLDGDVNSTLLILVLGFMAGVKFFLVVAWYMHLRTDLKIFRRMFVVGLLLAGAVYMIALTSLHIFNTGRGAR